MLICFCLSLYLKYTKLDRVCLHNCIICLNSLPEIPNDTAESNPVLRTNELVDYKTVGAETCLNAVAKLSLEQESGIWKLENQLSGLHTLFGL